MIILKARLGVVDRETMATTYRGPRSHFLYDLCDTPQAERYLEVILGYLKANSMLIGSQEP